MIPWIERSPNQSGVCSVRRLGGGDHATLMEVAAFSVQAGATAVDQRDRLPIGRQTQGNGQSGSAGPDDTDIG